MKNATSQNTRWQAETMEDLDKRVKGARVYIFNNAPTDLIQVALLEDLFRYARSENQTEGVTIHEFRHWLCSGGDRSRKWDFFGRVTKSDAYCFPAISKAQIIEILQDMELDVIRLPSRIDKNRRLGVLISA